MKLGRSKRVPVAVIGLLVAGFLWVSPAMGQDRGALGRTLDEAYDLQRRGQSKAANAKARQVLAADPRRPLRRRWRR